jgi:hypothetical protein
MPGEMRIHPFLNPRGQGVFMNNLAFDTWEFQGRVLGSLDDVNKTLFAGQSPTIDPAGSGPRTDEMPLSLDLIGFK